MSADPTKASIWTEADVYVAPLGSAAPATISSSWPVAWDLVGLLDGGDGFKQSRNEDKADHYAWGGILVKTTRRNYKQTVRFTALEDNATTRDLIWPGSIPGGRIVVPRPERLLVGFELREDDWTRRLITAYQAEIEVVDDIVDKEDDLTRYVFEATIFPDPSTTPAVLFYEQDSNLPGS